MVRTGPCLPPTDVADSPEWLSLPLSLFTNKSRAIAWFDIALPRMLVKINEAIHTLGHRGGK
jgi:hypothetical protein